MKHVILMIAAVALAGCGSLEGAIADNEENLVTAVRLTPFPGAAIKMAITAERIADALGENDPREEKRAKNNADANAQNDLGVRHERGVRLEKNIVTAYAWYDIAASNGHKGADFNRSILLEKLTTEQIAEGQLLSRELLAKYPMAATSTYNAKKREELRKLIKSWPERQRRGLEHLLEQEKP